MSTGRGRSFPLLPKRTAKARLLSAAIAFLISGGASPPLAGWPEGQNGAAAELDRALGAGDIARARRLVVENVGAADDLFLEYLRRDLAPEGASASALRPLDRAKRLANVYFGLFELGLERGVVAYWETAALPQKSGLLAILSDHFAVFKEERSLHDKTLMPYGWGGRFIERYAALADRYSSAAFGTGELYARLKIANLDPGRAVDALKKARALHDDVGEAWGGYFLGSFPERGEPEKAIKNAVDIAERLSLPRLLQLALTRLAWRAINRDDWPGHVEYLRKALAVAGTIPVEQTLVGRSVRSQVPMAASLHLALWRAAELDHKPEGQEEYERGLALSRKYGGRPAEMAYLIEAMPRFLEPGLFKDVAARAEALARRMSDQGWLVRVLIAKTDGLTGVREFGAAIESATEAADICRRLGEKGYLAAVLSKRGLARVKSAAFEEAATDFQASVDLYDEAGLAEEMFSAALDAAYYLRSNPAMTEGFFAQALAKAERNENEDLIGDILSERGRFRMSLSPEEAVRDLTDALMHKERASAKTGKPAELLGLMGHIGHALGRVGRVQEAMDIQKQRAEKARVRGSEDDEADAYYRLQGMAVFDLGDLAQAAVYVESLRELKERDGREPSVNECNWIAQGFNNIGQPARALSYWSKALDLARKIPGVEHFQRMLHNNMQTSHLKLGDYVALRSELDEVGKLVERTAGEFGGPLATQMAEWHNKMAYALALSGDAAKAAEEAREAVRSETSTEPGTVMATYYTYFSPAEALAQAGRFDEAVAFSEWRSQRARELKSEESERAALERLGSILLQAGNTAGAREAMRAAVDIGKKPPGPLTGGLAGALLGLAKIELQAGNIAGAEEAAAEARSVANEHDLNQVWQIERVSALAAGAGGKAGPALAHFEAALDALEAVGERLRPEEFRLRFGVDRLGVYDECAALLAAAAAKFKRTTDAEAALGVLERRRRQALWDILSTGWAGLAPEAMPDQLRAIRRAEEELAARQSVLRAQFALPPDKRNHSLIGSLETDLQKAKDVHASLLIGLAQGKYRYAAPGRIPDGLGGAVRRALGRGRALVEFLVGDAVSYAFVATASGLRVVELAAGREDLRRDVASLLKPFYRLRTGGLDVIRLEYDFGLAESLYRRLLAPLEQWLAGIDRILIVPDDVLFYLPFEALVDKRPEAGRRSNVLFADHQAASFLLHRYTFSYLAAAGHAVPQGPEKARPAEGWTLLALANPAAAPDSRSSGREDPFLRHLRSSNIAAAFSPLPGADSEVGKIRRYFPVSGVTVVSGREATEAAYQSMAGGYDIVHLATHAVASDDQAFYSTLILAAGPEGREDGFLQAYEILRVPLQARLVVLSACETALGPIGRGEGMVGLVSAFRQAGAGAVLATQWSIDESAAELMDTFYRSLTAGKDLPGALRQAKLATLKKSLRLGPVDISLAHPFFWAPFVLIGGTD